MSLNSATFSSTVMSLKTRQERNKPSPIVENVEDPVNCSERKASRRPTQRAKKPFPHTQCPCCVDDQVKVTRKRKSPASADGRPEKKKHTSVKHPDVPTEVPPQPTEVPPQPTEVPPQPTEVPPQPTEVPPQPTEVPSPEPLSPRPPSSQPPSPEPSSPQPYDLEATTDPEELPVPSSVAPCTQPIAAPPRPDSPIRIHNYSVEEYQKIYHEVVDGMLTYKSGRKRPYSLALGRKIKQKRVNRPVVAALETTGGSLYCSMLYGAAACPPQYDVDVSGEPKPEHYRTVV